MIRPPSFVCLSNHPKTIMKTLPLLTLTLLLTPGLASAAATAINFSGAITTASGPGSMTATGGTTTAFNTVSGFGLTAMAGGDRTVMSFSAIPLLNAGGLQFTHATPSPNATGYTVLMDVYYSAIPNFLSLLQLDNAADGDVFGRGSGAAGINSDYAGTTLTPNAWHRFVATVDTSLTTDFLNLYIDGSLINSVSAFGTAPNTSVNRFDLSDPSFLVFGDEDGETASGYISQFYFADRALSVSEVAAFGGTNAAAVPEPSGCLLSLGAAAGLLARRRRPAGRM